MGITTSATFVVNLNSLKHPDDIKKTSSENGSILALTIQCMYRGRMITIYNLKKFNISLNVWIKTCFNYAKFIASIPQIHNFSV